LGASEAGFDLQEASKDTPELFSFGIADNYASMAHDKYRNIPRARNKSSIQIAEEKNHPRVKINISVEICR